MNNILISVVMPIYNSSRFLGRAVESVLRQSHENIELILVDDASADNSLELAFAYRKNDPRVSVISYGCNEGAAFARNIGVQAASGEYIAFIDSDDVWLEDKLEKQLELIIRQKADLVYCSYDFIDENDCKILKPFIVPEKTDYKKMLVSSVISCSTAFAKATLLKEHPFREDFYHEDYALWMELLSIPIKAVGNREILAHYRQLSGSRSGNKFKSAAERWTIYRECLGMGFFRSACVFLKYAIKGCLKYWLVRW